MTVKGLYVFQKTVVTLDHPVAAVALMVPGVAAGFVQTGSSLELQPGVYRVADGKTGDATLAPAALSLATTAGVAMVDLEKGGGGVPDPPGKIVAMFPTLTKDEVAAEIKAVLDGQGDVIDV